MLKTTYSFLLAISDTIVPPLEFSIHFHGSRFVAGRRMYRILNVSETEIICEIYIRLLGLVVIVWFRGINFPI